jgi:hypothetical protein
MPISDEVLLMLLVTALYIYDSTLLLHCNEGVAVPTFRGWKIRFGLREPRIAGKELFLPAPWSLHRPMYRLSWRFEGDAAIEEATSGEAVGDWNARRYVPPILVLLVWSIAIVLFLILPLGFFTSLGNRLLLAGVGLLYISIVCALAYLWAYRDTMNLTRRRIGKLAFEYLICPPFALNLVRAVSLGQRVTEDLVSAARRLQSGDGWNAAREQLLRRLDEEIEMEDDASARMARLREQRMKLAE